MGSCKEFLNSVHYTEEQFRPNCLPQYGETIVPPNSEGWDSNKMLESLEGLSQAQKDMINICPSEYLVSRELEKIIGNPGLIYYDPCIEKREAKIEEIKQQRLNEYKIEMKNKAIIGQERQERIVWNKQKLPIKLFKYWRTKIK